MLNIATMTTNNPALILAALAWNAAYVMTAHTWNVVTWMHRTVAAHFRLLALCLLAVLTPMIVAAVAPVLLAVVALALPVLGKLAAGAVLIAAFAAATKPR